MKKLKIFSILVFSICLLLITNVYAASMSISGSSSANADTKVTLTIKGDFTGRVNLSVQNGTLSTNSVWIENNSQTVTVTLGKSGKTTVAATAATGASDASGNIVEVGSKSKSITIKENTTTTKPTTTTDKNTTTTKPNTTTNTTTNTNKKPTTTTTTKKPTTTKKKSTNADVIGLTVNVEGLSPKFDKEKTSYTLKVGSDVEKLRLGISLDDSRATYRVTGNKSFKTGKNTVKIIVTAEDSKTIKTYKIVVDKEPDLTLESLIIENGELTKEFDAGVLEYKLKDIDEKVKSLKINAVAKSEEVKVAIEGNENLIVGENIIKVIVSTEDNKYSKTYILKVNKTEAVPTISDNIEEEIVEENNLVGGILGEDEEKVKQNITIIALYLLAIVEFVQVVYLYKQLRAANPDYERITRKKDKEVEQYKRRKVVDIEIDDSKNEDN